VLLMYYKCGVDNNWNICFFLLVLRTYLVVRKHMPSGRVGKLATWRRRQRRLRQKLRAVPGRGDSRDLVRCGGVGAARSASPSTAAAGSVARVLPTVGSPAEVNVATTAPMGPAFYAPTATLDLHPYMLVPIEDQGPSKYLYLSKRFLSYL